MQKLNIRWTFKYTIKPLMNSNPQHTQCSLSHVYYMTLLLFINRQMQKLFTPSANPHHCTFLKALNQLFIAF